MRTDWFCARAIINSESASTVQTFLYVLYVCYFSLEEKQYRADKLYTQMIEI